MRLATAVDILTLPDPRLRQKSETVGQITPEIKDIIRRMREAALDWEEGRPHELSTAISAVQIGEMKRIVIVREDFSNPDNKNFISLINPEITKFSGKTTFDFEGCLSVPDFYGEVPRKDKIKIKAKNEHGQTIFLKADGFLSRILQHEIDHTNGVTFVDRIKNNPQAFYRLQKDGELKHVDYDQDVLPSGIFRDWAV